MRFTPAIACAILAYAGSSFASPMDYGMDKSTTAAATSTTTAQSTGPTAVAEDKPLSLTQKLFLADTAADRFALLPNDSDFVFDFNPQNPTPGSQGGDLRLANRKMFPALVGTNLAMAVGRLNPCGMNTLHVHPRAAEFQMVISGKLITEMVPENGVNIPDPKDPAKTVRRVIRTELGPFMATPFHQGSIHTQFNPTCEPAVFVAAFPTEDPGTGQIADETFALTDDVIAATFGQTIAGADIDKVRKGIPINIALGVDECLKQCGIKKSTA